jgi:hypothetical protein
VEVEISTLHTASNHGIESFNREGGGSKENEGMMIRRSSQTLQTLLLLLLPSPQPNTGFTEICSNQVFWLLLQQQDTCMINFLLLLFEDMETQIRSFCFF